MSTQLGLFDEPCPVCGSLEKCSCGDPPQPIIPPAIHPPFGGRTYDPPLDGRRLGAQLQRVLDLMSDGEWRTLRKISSETGDPEASVSARLRDFRKAPFGGHTMVAERISRGLWRYRLKLDQPKEDSHA